MEPQPVKIAVVFGILIIAIIAVLTFKRERSDARNPSAPGAKISVSKPPLESSAFEERLSRLTGHIRNVPIAPPSEGIERVDLDTPPPALPAEFSRDPSPELSSKKPFTFSPQALDQQAEPKKHRVRDGDTLASLAERYLGDAARATELLEANRAAIANPELLPIGMELTIPPAANAPDELDEEDLVPVAPVRPSKK